MSRPIPLSLSSVRSLRYVGLFTAVLAFMGANGEGCVIRIDPGTDVDCPAIAVECEDGAEPIDADGDGCAVECPNEA